MKLFQLLTASILISTSLLACSSGGRSRVQGRQCSASNPFPMKNLPASQKIISLKPGDSALPEGTYEYERADLRYIDDSGLQVQIQDVKQRDGSFKPSMNCVRNAKPGVEGTALSVEGVSKITPGAVEVKEYRIGLENTEFVASAFPKPQQQKPSDVYQGKYSDYFMIDHGDNNFEIRSSQREAHGEYFLSIRLKKK